MIFNFVDQPKVSGCQLSTGIKMLDVMVRRRYNE